MRQLLSRESVVSERAFRGDGSEVIALQLRMTTLESLLSV